MEADEGPAAAELLVVHLAGGDGDLAGWRAASPEEPPTLVEERAGAAAAAAAATSPAHRPTGRPRPRDLRMLAVAAH